MNDIMGLSLAIVQHQIHQNEKATPRETRNIG